MRPALAPPTSRRTLALATGLAPVLVAPLGTSTGALPTVTPDVADADDTWTSSSLKVTIQRGRR